jgi:hypothetical protein
MKAKFCRSPEEWPFSSAKFRDEFARLIIPPETPASGLA